MGWEGKEGAEKGIKRRMEKGHTYKRRRKECVLERIEGEGREEMIKVI